jgi:ElaB/YqjD/DUF883 family membrane-anchored ribosome-binding protein
MDTFDDPPTSFTSQAPNGGHDDLKSRMWEMTTKARNKAGKLAETMSEKMGQARDTAAGGLSRAATTTHSVADGMESTASYLRQHDFNQITKDAMDFCRRYPVQMVVTAMAVGFLIGRSRR